MRSRLRISSLLLLLSAPLVATAQNSSPTPDADAAKSPQQLRKISVTATRGPRELDDIAGSVTLIDEAQIRAQMATDIKELVRYEPGISVANAGARFGLAGFNIRGIDANRVLMRIDGVPMADAFSIGSFSDARRNLIDLDAVRSVEIIRGASSALYGSDAIGGVVSFIMREPEDYLAGADSLYVGGRSGYQSDDDGWYSGGTLALGDGRLSALLLYTHREGHEIDNQGAIGARDLSRTQPNPQQYDSDAALTKINWAINDDHLLKLALEADRTDAITDVYSAVGIAGPTNTVSMRGDDEQQRARASLTHEIYAPTMLFDDAQWMLYAQRTEITQRTQEQRYALSAGPTAAVQRDRVFEFEQSVLGAELVLRKEWALGSVVHHLTYGLDAAHVETEQLRDGIQTELASGQRSTTILPDVFPVRDFPVSETREYGMYVQDEIDIGRWSVVPGVRVDRHELDPEPDAIFLEDNPAVPVEGLTHTSTTPKLGLVRALGEHHTLFAQYARGFRAPPYSDVNIGFTNLAFGYTAIANPNLKPETSDGFELGLRGTFSSSAFELAAFRNEYDDFIESLVNVGMQNGILVFQSRNLSRAHIQGAEFKAEMDLAGRWPRLAGWAIRSSIAWAEGEDEGTDEPLNSVDPLKGVLGVRYSPAHERWAIDVIGTLVERKSRVDDSVAEPYVPSGYFTLDLLWRAKLGERWQLNAAIFNLTDEKYWEWADVRGRSANDAAIDRYSRPGINASASVSFAF